MVVTGHCRPSVNNFHTTTYSLSIVTALLRKKAKNKTPDSSEVTVWVIVREGSTGGGPWLRLKARLCVNF